nr:DUF2207 domain-containing protein [Pseudothermotoga thermarum]
MILNPDGSAKVVEKVTYRIKQPFRYVSWAIDFEDPITIEDINVEVLKGPSPKQVVFDRKTLRSVSLKVVFSPSMEEYLPVPKEGQIVEIAVEYSLKNILMEGKDFSQVFVKYIGKGTDVSTKLLKVRVVFPAEFGKPVVYHHPWGLQIAKKEITSNIYEFVFRNVPKNTFVEGRFVFPNVVGTGTENLIKASLKDVEKEERDYLLKNYALVAGGIAYLLVVLAFPIYVYRKYGVEETVDYQAEYEREPPTKDPPEIVNAIVKRLCQKPDSDAISAAMLDMVRLGRAKFVENEKREIIGIRILKEDTERKKLIECFEGYIKDGILLFKEIKKAMSNEKNAKNFLAKTSKWFDEIYSKVLQRNYMDTKGNTLAKTFAIIVGMIISFSLILLTFNVPAIGFEIVFSHFRLMMAACIVVSLVVISMKRTVFARWTKEGLLYYLRWKNFEKFLTDFSMLSSYPPQSVAIWDEYIVYATALGVAKEVIRNLKKLYPEPPTTSITAAVYHNQNLFEEIASIHREAAITVSKSSSSTSSGGTKVGTGSGGSRVGVG